MTAELGSAHLITGRIDPLPTRQVGARASHQRWTETTGANLLIVDADSAESGSFAQDMASRGIHVTWVDSTLDGLVEFGRTKPFAVIIAPGTTGIPAPEFVSKLRQFDCPLVIAALANADTTDAGPLMLAGASAVVSRPYTADEAWGVLDQSSHSLTDHERVSFGPIELDAGAYTVRLNGVRVADPPLKEFELLRILMLRAPEVVSDDELRSSLWPHLDGHRSVNAIKVHVGRLRSRLDGVAGIRRIRGRGYSLIPD